MVSSPEKKKTQQLTWLASGREKNSHRGEGLEEVRGGGDSGDHVSVTQGGRQRKSFSFL